MEVQPRQERSISSAVAALGLLTILAAALLLDVRSFLHRPPLVSPGSPFEGSVQSLADGSFVMPGDAGRPSVAHAAIRLRSHSLYYLEIELAGPPKVGVDFYGGPQYDFDEQEVTLPAGEKGGLRTRILRSGNAPDRALFRIFFHDPRDVWVGSVRLYQVKPLYEGIEFALVGLAVLLAGALALRRDGGAWHRTLGLGIALFLFYRVAEPAVADNLGDNYWYIPSSVSLIEDGDLDLSEYVPYGLKADDYRLFESRGNIYNFFPLGTTLAAAPMVLAAELVDGGQHPLDFASRLSSLAAAALAATAAALLYFLLCGLTGRGKALVLTMVFALATPHWTTHAGSLWSHNALLPFFLWALIALRSNHAWTAAIPLSMGVLTRPDFAPAVFLSLLHVWFIRPQQRTRFVTAASAAAAVVAIASLALHDWMIPPYYQLGPRLSLERFPEALLGHLFSPNRGLFVFAPILLGSVWGLRRGVRGGGGDAPFYALLGAMTISHWVTISLFVHWWGGYCYGPRLFSPMLPALIVLLVPALERWEETRGRRRIWLGSPAALLLAWSLFVQIRGVTDNQVQQWNSTPDLDAHPERIWDWKDLQILRGWRRP